MSDDSKLLVPAERLEDFGVTIKNPQRQILEAQGKFPKRVWVTDRRHAYVSGELREWCESKIRTRDAKLAGVA
jgi:hypothetical protein